MTTTLKCPLCDHTEWDREGLAAHLSADHAREMALAAAGLGGKCPTCGSKAPGVRRPWWLCADQWHRDTQAAMEATR